MVRSARVEKTESATVPIGANMSAVAPAVVPEGVCPSSLVRGPSTFTPRIGGLRSDAALVSSNYGDVDHFQALIDMRRMGRVAAEATVQGHPRSSGSPVFVAVGR